MAMEEEKEAMEEEKEAMEEEGEGAEEGEEEADTEEEEEEDTEEEEEGEHSTCSFRSSSSHLSLPQPQALLLTSVLGSSPAHLGREKEEGTGALQHKEFTNSKGLRCSSRGNSSNSSSSSSSSSGNISACNNSPTLQRRS